MRPIPTSAVTAGQQTLAREQRIPLSTLQPNQKIPLVHAPEPLRMPEPLAGSLAYQVGQLVGEYRDFNAFLTERAAIIDNSPDSVLNEMQRFHQARALDRIGIRFEELLAGGAVTPENFDEFVQAYQEGRERELSNATIEREFLNMLASRREETDDSYTAQARETWLDTWFLDEETSQNITDDLTRYLANSNTDTSTALVEFAQLLVPFLEQYRLRGVQEALGLEREGFVNTVLDYVWPSRMLDRIRGTYHSLRGEDRRNFARAIMEAAQAHSNVFGYQNDFLRFDTVTRLLDESYGENFDWDALFTNAAALADTVYAGRLLRAGALGLTGRGGTLLNRMNQTNPGAARRAAEESVDDATGTQVQALTGGDTPGQMTLNYLYPQPRGIDLHGGFTGLGDFQRRLQEQVRGILRLSEERGFNFTDAERAASPGRVLTSLQNARGVYAHPNKSTVGALDYDGYTINIMWGRNADVGFTSYAEAIQRADTILTPGELRNLEVYRRNPETGVLQRLSRSERARLKELHENLAAASRNPDIGNIPRLQRLLEEARVNAPEQVPAFEARIAQALKADDEVSNAVAALEAAHGGRMGNADLLERLNRALKAAEESAPEQVPAIQARIDEVRQIAGPEFFFEAPYRHNYTELDKFAFAPNDVGSGALLGRIFGGDVMRYLQDPSARFGADISTMVNRAGDISIEIEGQLHAVLGEFKRLNRKEKERILSIFDRASQEGIEVMDFQWIRSQIPDLSSAEWAGLTSLKAATDALYLLHNQRLVKQMTEQGFRTLSARTAAGEEFTHAAAPVTRNAAGEQRVAYDPYEGGEIRLSAEYLDDLYARGGSVNRTWSSIDRGSVSYNYIVHDPARGTRLSALPDEVLNYRAGYIPRIWKGAFFVDMKRGTRIVDGVSQSDSGRAVAVANSRKEAQRYVDEMNAEQQRMADDAAARGEEYTPITYSYRLSREMSGVDAFRADMEIMEMQGRLFYSHRGPELQVLSRTQDTNLVGPLESLGRGIAATAQKVGMETTIQSLKHQFMQTFGDLLPNPHQMPASIDALKSSTGDQTRLAQAQNMLQHIRFLEGLEPDGVNVLWRNLMLSLADFADARGWNRMTDFFLDRKRDPFSALRAAGFYAYLGANPVRQYLLQSQQVFMLSMWNPKYMATGAMLRDKATLDAAFAAAMWAERTGNKTVYQNTLQHLATVTRQRVEDIEAMVTDFRQSGLPAAVDHNMLVHDSVYSGFRDAATTWSGRMTQHAGNVAAYPFKIGKILGFDRGEFNNLAYTWLTVRNRYMRENPGVDIRSSKARNEIGGKARQLALTMTRQGSFGYQRGWLSLATQFLSIQHKTFLAFLPAFMGGNKALSASDKARIFTSSAIIWGASGFGLREILSQSMNKFGVEFESDDIIQGDGFRAPEMVGEFLYGGLMEVVLNALAETAFDEDDVNVAWSQEFAPASGIVDTPSEILRGIFMGEKTMIEMLLGPVGSYVSGRPQTNGLIGGRLGRAIDQMRMVAGLRQSDSLTDEEVVEMIEAAATILPAYNNYARMRYALQTGHLVNSKGRPTAAVTRAEAIIRGVFGVRSEAEIESYSFLQTQTERVRALQETADIYYDRLMEVTSRAAPGDDTEALTRAIRLESWIMEAFAWDDWEQIVIREQLYERMREAAHRGEDDFAFRMARLMDRGGVPPDQYLRTAIVNSQMDNERKARMLQMLDHIIATRETLNGTVEEN